MEHNEFVSNFELSPIAIEYLDSNGIIRYINQSFIDLFGIQSIENVQFFNLFTDPNFSQSAIADIKAGKPVKLEIEIDFELVKSDNLYPTSREGNCFLEYYIHPKIDENKEVAGYIVHIIEVTEQKKTFLSLKQQAEELQKLKIAKDKFLSIIAHDLKNPFNAIIGFNDLMISSFSDLDDETLLQGLYTIESASKHAFKLLENLLIWSQNQNGQLQYNPELLNLNSQLAETLNMIESTATIKGISLVNGIRKSIKIFADKNMIDFVLRNLILNAIKFSQRGEKVRINAVETDHEIQVSVIDNGVGVAPLNQSAIFNIDKHTLTLGTDNEQGTGFGLILCKDFIKLHNGTIGVESSPGKGSIFTFTLPAHRKSI
jgi:signal transduction histidine kinase